MIFKKKKQTPAEPPVKKPVATDAKKYSIDGNFPHVLLSYILILLLGILVFQAFSLNSKHTQATEKLYSYVVNQEKRIEQLESGEVKSGNKEEKDKENTVINNYYYGQSPNSTYQPGNDNNAN